MGMYSEKSYRLTKDEYNYLLPVIKDKLLYKGEIDRYYFCGDGDVLGDMLSRLKGLYNYFDNYNYIINYNCFKNGSLETFRDKMKELERVTLPLTNRYKISNGILTMKNK